LVVRGRVAAALVAQRVGAVFDLGPQPLDLAERGRDGRHRPFEAAEDAGMGAAEDRVQREGAALADAARPRVQLRKAIAEGVGQIAPGGEPPPAQAEGRVHRPEALGGDEELAAIKAGAQEVLQAKR
jgi:hypothetical protein